MRTVTFIDSKTQSQKVLGNSNATTLGELKAEMSAAGIDYDGMSFYEGHIRAELIDDASILPTNISYKGHIVNDLVFMLSTPNKKIKSGSERSEAYQDIKRYQLENAVKDYFGRNYTQVTTENLKRFVLENTRDSFACEEYEQTENHLLNAVYIMAQSLRDCLGKDYDYIMSELNYLREDSEGLSYEEIEEMFDFVQ